MESRRSLRTTMEIRCRIERSRDSFLVVGAEPIYSLLLRALATGAVLLDALTRRRGVPLHFAGLTPAAGVSPASGPPVRHDVWRRGQARCRAEIGMPQAFYDLSRQQRTSSR